MSRLGDDRLRVWSGCVLSLLALMPACAAVQGKDVVVGNEGDTLIVSRCLGSKTQCTKDADTKSLEAKEVPQCAQEMGSELVLDWEVNIEPTPCMDSAADASCGLQPRVAVTSDGSAWVVTTYDSSSDPGGGGAKGVWLGHYDAHGALIAGTTVTAEPQPIKGFVDFFPDLALKDDGHVVVAVYSIEMADPLIEHVLVREYDDMGRGVGTASTLSGISRTRVAIAANGDVILAANGANNAHHGVLTRLSHGKIVFSQTNVDTHGQGAGSGITGVTVDSKQRTSVLMARKVDTDGQRFAITQFDVHGNPIWDRELETMLGDARLAIDADDNLIVQSSLDTDFPNEGRGMITKLSPKGELLFQSELGPEVALQLDIARANTIFAQATGEGPGNAGLLEIAADGSSCVEHRAPPLKRTADGAIMLFYGYYSFGVAPEGEVYFTSNNTVGRYKTIAGD